MQKYNPETSLKPQEEYFRNKVDLRVWCRVLGIVPHESSEKEVKNALQKLKKETLDAPFTNKAGESLEKSAEPDGNITACAKKFKSGDDWYRHEIGETKNHDGLVARAATIEPNVMVVYKSLERMKNGMND